MNTVHIIGGGNIGRRHLQALSAIRKQLNAIVIENATQARNAIKNTSFFTPKLFVTIGEKITELPKIPADLTIIATTAEHRFAALEELLSHSPPKALLLEKILFRTNKELLEAESLLQTAKIPTWVNCGRRGFPAYTELRKNLFGKKNVKLYVTGSCWGLCCNAIHFLDLIDYVLGDTLTSLSPEKLEKTPTPAKRPGCVELYGTLMGYTANGGEASLTCSREPGFPLTIEFVSDNDSWVIDETNATITHKDYAGNTTFSAIEIFHVSTMPFLYTEIIETQTSRLTPYTISASQHHLLIDTIRRHLVLSVEEDIPCPIT